MRISMNVTKINSPDQHAQEYPRRASERREEGGLSRTGRRERFALRQDSSA